MLIILAKILSVIMILLLCFFIIIIPLLIKDVISNMSIEFGWWDVIIKSIVLLGLIASEVFFGVHYRKGR